MASVKISILLPACSFWTGFFSLVHRIIEPINEISRLNTDNYIPMSMIWIGTEFASNRIVRLVGTQLKMKRINPAFV